MRRSISFIILGIFLTLVIYLAFSSMNKSLSQQSKQRVDVIPTRQIVGGDRDEHGCIGSAGYTWCEEKQKCLRSWEEECRNVSVNVPEGWLEYKSESLSLSLYYPPEMELNENPDGSVRFLILGPSQSRGTEVYDGIILTFSKGQFTQNNLKDYVRDMVYEKKKDDIYIEVSGFETVNIAGKNGYKFTESALGTFTNIYLPAEEAESFVEISYLLEDPKKQGFQETLQNLLQTLKFN